jgi:hypothetical protein
MVQMAKLSARGRKELVRYKKSVTKYDEFYKEEVTTKYSLAIMDDGRILRKVSWKDHGGNWVLWKKLKKEIKKGQKATLEDFVNTISSLEKQGYVKG